MGNFKTTYLRQTGIRPVKKNTFNISDKYGLILLSRLRVNFSDLRQHRFNHNFNCPSALCKCGIENETTEHFLLRCPCFTVHRLVLVDTVTGLLHNENNEHIAISTELLLYGSNRFNTIANKLLLEATIRYIKCCKRFLKIEAYDK